jgi:tetratricopeptide (TPR) repeat protein
MTSGPDLAAAESVRPFRMARGTWAFAAVIAVVVGITFMGVFSAGFVEYDDGIYVFNNPHVLAGLTGEDVRWAFTNHEASLWIPLTWMSFQVDATMARGLGLGPTAAIYHADNLLLHVAAAIVLFFFLYRATRERWLSFAGAILWAVHPLRVESVAWVTERKDVLSGVFGFLTAYVYVASCERKSWWLYGAFGCTFVLSLIAKTAFITLPFVLLLLDFWPLRRVKNAREFLLRILEKVPILLITALFIWIEYAAAASASYTKVINVVPLLTCVANALVIYVDYLRIHLDLLHLACFYPFPRDVAVWEYAVCGVFLLGVTAACAFQWRRRPALIVGWLWFLGTLVIMVGPVQTGLQAYADRFTYFPSVGLVLMLWAIPWRWVRTGGAVVAVVVAVALSIFSMRQVGLWHDTLALARHAIAVTDGNYTAWNMLGDGYVDSREPALAAAAYEKALEIKPDFNVARVSLASQYVAMQRWEDALRAYARAVEMEPNNPVAHNLYGIALGRTRQFEAAAREFEIAARLKPQDAQLRKNLETARRLAATQTQPVTTQQ